MTPGTTMTRQTAVGGRGHRKSKPGPGGFTLVELLIGLVISGLVAAGVTAMLVAVSYGTSSSHDLRTLVVKSKTIDARLGASIRNCRQVLATGSDFLLLWVADADEDDVTDNAEIRLIDRDAATDMLNSYYDDTAAGAYVDAATFRTLALGSFTPQPWGTGVTGLSFVPDTPAPGTKLVSYTMTLEIEDVSETVVGAVATRN